MPLDLAAARTFFRNLLAALAFLTLGVYLLRYVPGMAGSVGGVICLLIAIGIAFPTQMHDGSSRARDTLVMFIPVVKNLLPGGSRADDPKLVDEPPRAAAPASAPISTPAAAVALVDAVHRDLAATGELPTPVLVHPIPDSDRDGASK